MENQTVILFLNRLLANFFILHTKLYRYRWFSKGEMLLTTKVFFEQLQDDLRLDIEAIATHILSLNGKPFATMIKFIKEASLEEAEADDLTSEMFVMLEENLQQIISEIKDEGILSAKKAGDDLTIHFLYELKLKLSHQLVNFQHISFEK